MYMTRNVLTTLQKGHLVKHILQNPLCQLSKPVLGSYDAFINKGDRERAREDVK